MNPYDAAQPGQSGCKSRRIQAFSGGARSPEKRRIGQNMLIDFRKQQLELQKQKLTGLEVAPEQEDKLEKLYQVISMNLTVKRFMEAEYRLGVLLQDVQKIIAGATADLFDPDLFALPELEEDF